MPVFTSKTSTDPGPFDALHPAPAGERGLERTTLVDGLDPASDRLDTMSGELVGTSAGRGSPQQIKHSGSSATDEDGELDHLYRFREIPVTAEMRRELLGAKLPLASVEQLADTQPPHKSSLSAPVSSFVDRHAPTEPGLPSPSQHAHDTEPLKHERQLLEGDSYSTTAPTLLSVRRKRLRNQRYVIGALAAMILAIFSGVVWRRYTRPPASLARTSAAESTKKPHIAGNSPGSLAPPQRLDPSAGDAIEMAATPTSASPDDENSEPSGSESATSDSQSAQLGSPATDATSSSPLSADSRSASRGPQPASAPRAPSPGSAAAAPSDLRATPPSTPAPSKAPTGRHGSATPSGKVEPGKSKAFDPEELIF